MAAPPNIAAMLLQIALSLTNPLPTDRKAEPVICGVPLQHGFVQSAQQLNLMGPKGDAVPFQVNVTGKYADGSPRWVLLTFLADVPANGKAVYLLTSRGSGRAMPPKILRRTLTDGVAEIDTGVAKFRIDTKKFRLFDSVKIGELELIGKSDKPAGPVLTDAKGVIHVPEKPATKVEFEDAGPLRAVLCVRGEIGPTDPSDKLPLMQYVCRMQFVAGTSEVRVFFTLHNPSAQNHPGNIWELGAGGSSFVEDFSLVVPLAGGELGGYIAGSGTLEPAASVKLYQDSSGGENWDSVNHINKDYKVPMTFRGYRVFSDGKQVAEGHRIDGWVAGGTKESGLAVAVREFWQNCPKALEFADGRVRVGLWPAEFSDVHEILGGEQKTHEMLFLFAGPGLDLEGKDRLEAFHSPMYAMPDAKAVLASNCLWPTAPLDREKYGKLEQSCDTAVYPRGGDSRTFITMWERIDQFDWRHFGDTFADNEGSPAAMVKAYPKHHMRSQPISHYVNEYEYIYGVALHGLRRGDQKWMWLFDVMARHHADICVYHTDVGAKAYGHGTFFHTTHDTAAYRSTFRSYPIEAKKFKLQYGSGGGPNAGHTYVTGLAQHFYLTGNRVSREAFLEVAGWCADSTWFRKGGMGDKRGFGNFLSTLFEAFLMTGDEKFYKRSMTLIGWIEEPFSGLGGTLVAKAMGRFLQWKLDNNQLDADYRKVQALLCKFGDHYLTLPASRWERWIQQRAFHAEMLCLAYLYAPKDHPNREKYYAKGRKIVDEALDRFTGRYMGTKGWAMCFPNIGAYLKAGVVHAAEAERD